MHACIRTNVYACIHTHQHAYTHTCTHMCLHLCVNIYIYIRSSPCMRAYTHTHINTYMRAYTHDNIHACTHKYIHACMHTDMNACIHVGYVFVFSLPPHLPFLCFHFLLLQLKGPDRLTVTPKTQKTKPALSHRPKESSSTFRPNQRVTRPASS